MAHKEFGHMLLLRVAVYGILLLLIVIVQALKAQKQEMDVILSIVSSRF